MASNIFSASLSGMNAAQYGLATTQHNIANASTPGYTRQAVQTTARAAQASGAGFVGQGVDVTGVVRNYDAFLTGQVRQVQSQASYLNTYLSSMTQVDNLVSNSTSGLSTTMQNYFSAMTNLSNNPTSVPARQTALSSAQSVVNGLQSVDQSLTSISNGLSNQISGSVQNINRYSTQIATLNSSITSAIATGQGQQPNDLMDQRDQLINQLNAEIPVSVQQQSDGSMNVYVGNGQALVVASQSMGMQVVQNPNDPTKVDVAYLNNGKTTTMQQSSLQGGNLGAYLTFRDQSLEPARNSIGLVAIGLASSINQQNQMGQDLNGAQGANLFNAASPRVSPGANNTGSGAVTATISSVSSLTTSDYQLKYDGLNYTMLRLSDSKVTSLGTSLVPAPVVDGVTVNLTGAMTAGDSFTIRPTANGARDIALMTSDPAKIATAAPMMASAATTNLGTGTITAGSVTATPPVTAAAYASLQAPVSLTFTSPTTFTVTGAVPAVVGAQAYTTGQNISYNGWTTQLSGAPSTGDVFNVNPNTTASGDNRNSLLLAGLQSQNLLLNGTATLQNTFGQLVGSVGSKTQELTVTSQAQATMVTNTVAAQQSVSGVNLDEEAANLLRYQRSYQASAKAMQIANTMFDSLLTLGR